MVLTLKRREWYGELKMKGSMESSALSLHDKGITCGLRCMMFPNAHEVSKAAS